MSRQPEAGPCKQDVEGGRHAPHGGEAPGADVASEGRIFPEQAGDLFQPAAKRRGRPHRGRLRLPDHHEHGQPDGGQHEGHDEGVGVALHGRRFSDEKGAA